MVANKIMVVAAHPDDEILGCGGIIAKMIAEGAEVRSVILGEGALSRDEDDLSSVESLKQDARSANEVLGVKDLVFYNFPDNAFDSVRLLDIVRAVEKEIAGFAPDVIFTHYANDLNIDHRKTYEAVMTSCRPQNGKEVPEIYSFFIPSSTDWADNTGGTGFVPNVYHDISDYIDVKLRALAYYKSEMRDYPHSRSIEALKIFSQYWGNRVGLSYAEPLLLIRKVII